MIVIFALVFVSLRQTCEKFSELNKGFTSYGVEIHFVIIT